MPKQQLATKQQMVAAGTPYGLTGLQHAYWVGQQDVYKFNTAPFLYFCYFSAELDIPRLESALTQVLCSFPELSMEFLPDASQRVAAPLQEPVSLKVIDWRQGNEPDCAALQALRKQEMEQHLQLLGEHVQVSAFVDQVSEGCYVNVAFRLISFDAFSVRLFYNALVRAYAGMEMPQQPRAFFPEFLQKRQAVKDSSAFQRSMQYWEERLDRLRNAPELPVVDHEQMPQRSKFTRIRLVFDTAQAIRLNEQARKLDISLSMLICTCYTDVLRLWSRNRDFTINMLMSHRPSRDPRFQRAFGNFGTTLLLESADEPGLFAERAKVMQRQLARDIRHSRVEGVDVIRAMGSTGSGLPVMPVVFATSHGLNLPDDLLLPEQIGWRNMGGGLHTPQVWLDCQTYMYQDQLVINWDYVEDLFLPGVIDDMFAAFGQQLQDILQDEAVEQGVLLPQVPERGLQARQAANATARQLPTGRLESFIARASIEHAARPAIIAPDRTLDYHSLWACSSHLAARLRSLGVGADDLVAVIAQRSWRQVTALVGVVQSGGAYLPITAEQPLARKQWLIERPGVKVVLVERALAEGLQAPQGVELLYLEDVLPDEVPQPVELVPAEGEQALAYVIFTSGSTGQPKGVAIDHRGAVNTIQDVIARFGLDHHDRMIGLSSFNFDLSVHDIFGGLASGAALVLPPHSETPAPDQWADCVQQHGVTVWNTVPASLEMLIEFLGPRAPQVLASLRLVMLSGDWIPVTLPSRLQLAAPQASLISLGGATEASIWSNYFPVEQVLAQWKSIPYGWPLSNQSFHVLTRELQPAPDWVPGDLYIGGIGLAREYYGDAQRTAESFIIHPQSGERLYRTGDVGRYFPDGCLEFLGRLDGQVKIRGFRIELDEIDANLARCPGIRAACTLVARKGTDSRLVAIYQPAGEDPGHEAIRQHLADNLPPYMIPSQFHAVAAMPVTANAKIDRKALNAIASELAPEARQSRKPCTSTQQRLAGLWSQLLGIEEVGIDEEFFDLGGTSLLAVRLINAIQAEFGQSLPLASLLQHGSIARLASMLDEAGHNDPSRSPLAVLRDGDGPTLIAVHPVGGNILCYRQLIELLPQGVRLLGLQSPGDGNPRTLAELAASYIAALCQQCDDPQQVHLFGWSMGGVIAHEMVRQLQEHGMTPASLTMIDSWMADPANAADQRLEGDALMLNFLRDLLNGQPLPLDIAALSALPLEQRPAAIVEALHQSGGALAELALHEFMALLAEYQANYDALLGHRPQPVALRGRLFRASRDMDFPLLAPFGFKGPQALEIIPREGDHFTLVDRQSLQDVLACITTRDGQRPW